MEYLNEQQQVDQLKAWWKEYGLAILAGILLAIIIVFFLRYYHRYEDQKAQQASLLYTEMINGVLSQQAGDAQTAANKLIKDYPRTPYAAIAQLWIGAQAASQQNYTLALQQFDWVIQHGKMSALRQVARIRSAQVYLQQKNPQQALQILSKTEDNAYIGLVDEVRGDAYLQMNQKDKAWEQYQLALKEIPQPTLTQPLLAMKLSALPVSVNVSK